MTMRNQRKCLAYAEKLTDLPHESQTEKNNEKAVK